MYVIAFVLRIAAGYAGGVFAQRMFHRADRQVTGNRPASPKRSA
jgi:hypothetical protein